MVVEAVAVVWLLLGLGVETPVPDDGRRASEFKALDSGIRGCMPIMFRKEALVMERDWA